MDSAAWEAVSALMRSFTKTVRALDGQLAPLHQLGTLELRLLQTIAAAPDGRMRPVDLAREAQLSASGATRALEGLRDRGLVRAIEDPSDRRASPAALTERGRSTLQDATVTAHGAAQRLLRRLSLGQTRQLIRLLEEIGE